MNNFKQMTLAQVKQLAQENNADAQYELALRYLWDESVDYNEVESDKWMKKASDNGHLLAQAEWGNVLVMAKNKEYHEEGFNLLKDAVAKGEKRAMEHLAFAYFRREDDALCKEGIELLKKSADLGYGEAAIILSRNYRNGWTGLEQSYDQAVFWAKKALMLGESDSLIILRLLADEDAAITPKEVFELCKAAAEANPSAGLYDQLASYYEKGYGVEQNMYEAAMCRIKAAMCDYDITDSRDYNGYLVEENCQKVASYYAQGIGVEKNLEKAAFWRLRCDELCEQRQNACNSCSNIIIKRAW